MNRNVTVPTGNGVFPEAGTGEVIGRSPWQPESNSKGIDACEGKCGTNIGDCPAGVYNVIDEARAAQDGGSNPYAWWGWGRALAAQGRFDLAVDKYRKAIELYPVMAEAYTDLGAALSAQGKTDEALALFAQGEKAGPRYARLYHEWGLAWGLALDRAGRKEEAATRHAKAAALAAEQHVKW